MKILAFDTTAKTATVAVTEDEKLIALSVLNTNNTHSVTLLPLAESLLCNAGIDIDDIDLFACSSGPGSFTGVRIGVATVKGLAFAKNKPCIGVSALEALALNTQGFDGIICPTMDARRNQLYNALFRYIDGKLVRITEDRVISKDELKIDLEKYNEKIILNGDGINIIKKVLDTKDIIVVNELMLYHNAYSVAKLAYNTYDNLNDDEKQEMNAKNISPIYLRASQAERERNEKLNLNN